MIIHSEVSQYRNMMDKVEETPQCEAQLHYPMHCCLTFGHLLVHYHQSVTTKAQESHYSVFSLFS